MIGFLEASLKIEAKKAGTVYNPEVCDRLRNMINVTPEFVRPRSFDSLEGKSDGLNIVGEDPYEDKKWAWG
jgi:hypothetical protein